MTLQTSYYSLISSMNVDEIMFIEVPNRYGFIYRTGIDVFQWDMIVGEHYSASSGFISVTSQLSELFYVEKISTESAPPVLLAAEATKLCICDWTSVQQVGCKCGAITPYKGGLYE